MDNIDSIEKDTFAALQGLLGDLEKFKHCVPVRWWKEDSDVIVPLVASSDGELLSIGYVKWDDEADSLYIFDVKDGRATLRGWMGASGAMQEFTMQDCKSALASVRQMARRTTNGWFDKHAKVPS
jgi:hypothetical protein